jgi:hypothetical protein
LLIFGRVWRVMRGVRVPMRGNVPARRNAPMRCIPEFPIANSLALIATLMCLKRLEWHKRRLTEELVPSLPA